MSDWDVLIVGAGPAGCATALALLDRGPWRVRLVDLPLQQAFRIGESATPDVPGLLRRLGLPGDMAGHRPYHANLSLWGGVRQVDDFLHRGTGHGWHLERAAFDQGLRDAVCERGAQLLRPASVSGLRREAGGRWLLNLGSAGVCRARWIVDAGGRRAPLANRLGVAVRRVDELVAVASTLPAPAGAGLGGLTLVEPCAHGWWYAAALPDGGAVVSLMSDADLVRSEGLREPARFVAAWRATAELRQRVPPPCGFSLHVFPAHSSCLSRAAGDGWLAAGDALMGFDPLTSSGIAGALSDALAAAEVLETGLRRGDVAAAAGNYGRRANDTFVRYLAQRQEYYGAELRWASLPFWLRRVGLPVLRDEVTV